MADFTKQQDHSTTSTDHSTSSSPLPDEPQSMGMSGMTFVVSTTTPLYASSWAPTTLGQYAGACVFLIVLGFFFRFLLAWKHVLEHSWAKRSSAHRIVIAASASSTSVADEKGSSGGPKTPAEVLVLHGGWKGRPWRFSTDLPRSAMTLVLSGVGYLLMLAVMTMNVGYFISVLMGLFVGELAWGRYIESAEH